MTPLHALKAPLTPLSQSYVVIDISPIVTTFAKGSRPLESGPLPVRQLSIPTDGSPEVQYQHVMETAQRLQGMALSVCPSCIPAAPKVPLQPALAHSTLPPRPLPQLLTAPAMGAQFLPPTSTQHYALHAHSPPGDQPFGLVGA